MIGTYESGLPGPTVIVVAGIRGNDPAGVIAAKRITEELVSRNEEFRGRFIALAGNISALAAGVRYQDRDLARLWSNGEIQRLRARPPADDSPDEAEQRELLVVLDRWLGFRSSPTAILTLECSSTDGPPFSWMTDTLSNRRVAAQLPIPAVLGLAESAPGNFTQFNASCRHVSIAVQAGAREDSVSVDVHEAAIRCFLSALQCLTKSSDQRVAAAQTLLRSLTGSLSNRVFEVSHRHDVTAEDEFGILPGWANLQLVNQGEQIGQDRFGSVKASESGRILRPLYTGPDYFDVGFWLVQPVGRAWQLASLLTRTLGLSRMVSALPGVSRIPGDPHALLADPHVVGMGVSALRFAGYRQTPSLHDRVKWSRTPEARLSPRTSGPTHADQRFAHLVDESFYRLLSEREEVELERLRTALEIADTPIYDRAIRHLSNLLGIEPDEDQQTGGQ